MVKSRTETLTGQILDQGSLKENKLGVKRRLRNQRFKGPFNVTIIKTKNSSGGLKSVKFKATRKTK